MKIILALLVLFLSGCATTKNSYVPPSAQSSNTATIISSWTRNGLTDWEGYSIEAIDGKYVSYGLSDRDWVTFPIAAGTRTLLVHGQYNRTMGGTCPCQAFAELKFQAEAGKDYQVVGEVKGVNIEFWIIDKNTKDKVSNIARGGYGRSPQDVFIPVYIPM